MLSGGYKLSTVGGGGGGGGGGEREKLFLLASACSTASASKTTRAAMTESNHSSSNNNNNKSNNCSGKKDYEPYNHTDPNNRFRWTARESFQYMYDEKKRPWHRINDFFSSLINYQHPRPLTICNCNNNKDDDDAVSAVSSYYYTAAGQKKHTQEEKEKEEEELTDNSMNTNCKTGKEKGKGGRWERRSFKIVLSYHGASFDGWQKQPNDLNTVQALLEKLLGTFVDQRKAKQLKDRSLPVEASAIVAGRTDKGVTALHQVCSFYTWSKDVCCSHIKDAINHAAPGKLRAVSVSEVSRVFHPNFAAKWRRYLYVFPLDDPDKGQTNCIDDKDAACSEIKPTTFRVSKVNQLLGQLQGKFLSYRMFARDTKASRSSGPPTECFMFHARAAEAKLPCTKQAGTETRVMCVELVANRFLRKMVRVLVATAIREAAAGADADGLIKLMDASCRRATAPPAPPDGLCLVDVGYGDFEPHICFIQ